MVKRRRDKVKLPSSGAGLVRYMDEEGQGLKIKPEHIAMAAGAVIVLKIALTSF
ncbi:MAG TPA: preprotein translocase subunit Sec61beta [Euryarchaeota archaeon]|nr:preprotein translocase subunit SecG [archaeon BMS3Abin16]HDH27906.1 preprotein translocase subunit Sec61beta [Euryarchaeota archaeon]